MQDRVLETSVDAVIAALEAFDREAFGEAMQELAQATPRSRPDEVADALTRLAPVLAELPIGVGGHLAQLAGSMVDFGGTPDLVLPVLIDRACEALEAAARFRALHEKAFGAVPDPDDHEAIPVVIERFAEGADALGLSEAEGQTLIEAWFTAGVWVQPVLYLAQRRDVRVSLPQRERLTAAVEATREHIGTAGWLHGLLLVLDDEPLIVLHRQTGRAFEVTISGIGDNFQLHTLLAAAVLDGDDRPSEEEIAAATDGPELSPAGGMTGRVNLVDGEGTWIWNEGRPADIPVYEGARVVVLDPPPYKRTWNTGRPYPLMVPSVTAEQLPTAEAAAWLSKVKPAA
ncbi:hypothetical protein J2S43_002011 [Catenuloplanes nepalensis]|uniref:Uncharacterized protein n=1 Tax=Catenuloplanes nepalensis TaxID=587533 RepID=A0ABT9MQ00_9ACTN|nr:hypothetical protein [Catenuloplanes nepalensis]MDP9793499.1 hypothetical protein [Catenuloplanes nepalensis]